MGFPLGQPCCAQVWYLTGPHRAQDAIPQEDWSTQGSDGCHTTRVVHTGLSWMPYHKRTGLHRAQLDAIPQEDWSTQGSVRCHTTRRLVHTGAQLDVIPQGQSCWKHGLQKLQVCEQIMTIASERGVQVIHYHSRTRLMITARC